MIIRLLAVASLLTLLCPRACANPRILGPDEAPRPAILAAASEFLAKLADGDAPGVKALFAGDGEQTKLLDAHLDWIDSLERLRKLWPASQPPEEPPIAFMVPKIIRARIDDLGRRGVFVNGDQASIASGRELDLGMRLQRQNGNWRVTHLVARRADSTGLGETLHAWSALAKATEAQIRAGRAKTRQDIDRFAEKYVERFPMGRFQLIYPATAAMFAPPSAPAVEWETPSVEKLVGLPGTPLPSDEMPNLVASLPGLPYAMSSGRILSFIDEEAGLSVSSTWKPPRAVTSVELFARAAFGCAQYPGKLPHQLSFSDRRADVEKKLGRPPLSMTESSLYCAMYPTLGLEVAYQNGSGHDPASPIHHITLLKPDPAADSPVVKLVQISPRLSFRLVNEDPASDDPKFEGLPMRDARFRMLVAREPVLDERLIVKVYPTISSADAAKRVIGFEMTQEGAARLQKFSAANIGREFAVVFDGKILVIARINAALPGQIVIDPRLENQAVEHLANRLHAAVNSLP
jgi:hypothetical protein